MPVMTCPQASQSRQIGEETIVTKLNELATTKEIAERIDLALAKKGRNSLDDLTEDEGQKLLAWLNQWLNQ
jgi:hypothetical protein